MSGLRMAVALGAGGITAVLPDRELSLPLDPPLQPTREDPGPALRQGLGRLEAALRSAAGDHRLTGPIRLQVALLPPLSEVRLVELPPLDSEEIETILRRIAPRHFLGGHLGLVVGGERFGRGESADHSPVFAAAASRVLVESLHQAAAARGWQLERIVPAQAAWLQALRQAAPLSGRGGVPSGESRGKTRLVVAVEGEVAHLVRMAGERLERLRHLSTRDTAAVVAAAGPDPGWALLLAEGEAQVHLARALQEAGWVLIRAGGFAGARAEAARHIAEAVPELVSLPLARVRQQRNRRLTVRMLTAAGLMLLAAAAVHLWGVSRACRAVRLERAQLRGEVAPVLAIRDSLDRTLGRIESLQALGGTTAPWTSFLVELSVLLPRETHLISLRGDGERAVVEAVGGRAGDALAALRQATTFRDVRLEGLIQRDLEGGATSRERFTLSMILSPEGGGR